MSENNTLFVTTIKQKSKQVMVTELTTKEYWRRFWEGISLPVIEKPKGDIHKILCNILPKSNKVSFIEIGCAPGGFMAYFNKYFGYSVSGMEYVKNAAAITRRNMEIQGIRADVLNLDFFEAEITAASYDVVFSGGFIEHFEELDGVVRKIIMLSRQYVVTLIPNLYGLNGFISKVIRPNVFYRHKCIDTNLLRRLHEECGLDTLFCDYVGGLQFIMPAARTAFFDKNKRFSKIVNLPFRVFNHISRTFSEYTNVYPRTKLLSRSLMYIGKKP